MTTAKKSSKNRLAELVEKLIAEDPYPFDGFMWAKRPHAFYLEELGFSQSTLSGLIKDIPFVRTARSGGWKTSLPEVCVRQIETAWGDLMTTLGYELTTTPVLHGSR